MGVEEILPGLFRVEVPLPLSPLRSINSWVIPARPRSLVIDTGMLRPDCEEALLAGLGELNIDLGATDVFATHLHADHLGLVTELAARGARILMGDREAAIVESWTDPEQFVAVMEDEGRRLGFPGDELKRAAARHPGLRYSPRSFPPFVHLEEGDELRAGEYRFKAVETPGHTPGHMCLWDEKHRILVSGDHILGDITPNIATWPELSDALGDYLASLAKVRALDAELALPGHRTPVRDVAGRIDQLVRHHDARLEEAVEILRGGERTAYEAASEMTWDIEARDWDHFPTVQKWFASQEAASHLRHLETRGMVTRNPHTARWRLL